MTNSIEYGIHPIYINEMPTVVGILTNFEGRMNATYRSCKASKYLSEFECLSYVEIPGAENFLIIPRRFAFSRIFYHT